MDYEVVLEIIEKEWDYISSIEAFKEIIEEKYNSSYEEALEAIKDYVKYIKVILYDNTDEIYITEFLKDMCKCAILDDRFNDLYKYSYILSEMYRDLY